jgi:hypothetical protein
LARNVKGGAVVGISGRGMAANWTRRQPSYTIASRVAVTRLGEEAGMARISIRYCPY